MKQFLSGQDEKQVNLGHLIRESEEQILSMKIDDRGMLIWEGMVHGVPWKRKRRHPAAAKGI
jgi:hypothetical protein